MFSIYRALTFAAILCALSMQFCMGQPRIARALSEPAFAGELKGISAEGDLTFATESGEQVVPGEQLITWGALHDSADGAQVVLADGSLIVADSVTLDGQSLVIRSNLFGDIEGNQLAGTSRLPVGAVKAIIFRVPLSAGPRDALFERIDDAKGNEDQIWLANGDMLSGTVNRLGPRAIGIDTADGPLVIQPAGEQGRLLEKVTALVFNPALIRPARLDQPRTMVGFADGSRLQVKHFQPDGERLAFELACGATLTSHPDENIVHRITSLQALSSTVQYLSEIQPRSYRHTPLLDRRWPLGVDESVTGGRLRSGGHVYVRGLGMHSYSGVIFSLKKRYRKFEAELAIDESAGEAGSVHFVVRTVVDRKFERIYESPVVRGDEQPLPISIDISGLTNLALFVTNADGGAAMDRANWLNARLIE